MAIRLIDIIWLIALIISSNSLCVLLGAYIAWRCKENKSILSLPNITFPLNNNAETMNEKRYKKILDEGVTEV
ncbi:MAG: hypothetical protein CO162_02665 [bacterium (Candidatus Ratteibacteria) CG_4_9_14_3_um_filter_41_21]|uniref:Uncharacterized protein n=1 Tax=bacterium (Candidatus Ratteibacteria) CG_4_9_14_3_um_filter_41_21 TaxID=2014289 RepID=A0A2M7YGM5_9BACT|nr:MAG: hypothetical protein CO162_02665 [bacterium (Candidatus Ratteibacteria) CG_4_9_14_3_um_filter_41_21]